MKLQVTVVGHLCIDHNFSEHATYVTAGGPARFISKINQQLPSVSTQIMAPIGQDFQSFEKELTVITNLKRSEQTLIYENRTMAGARVQKAFNRAEAQPVSLSSRIHKILVGSQVLFLAPLLPNFNPEYVSSVVTHVNSQALKILIPQGYFRDFDSHDVVIFREFREAQAILPLFDVMILSELDYPDLDVLAEEWSVRYQIVVLVTLGDRGCLVINGRHRVVVPVEAVPDEEIVDSVGSGDIFSAAFAYAYHQKHDLMSAVEFANSVARQCLFYSAEEIKITL